MRSPLFRVLTVATLLASAFVAPAATAQLVRPMVRLPVTPMVLNLHRRMTAFDPAANGFRFINSFKTVTGAADITTNGLCGGMVYTALDYFTTGTPVPRQNYTPVNGTRLQSYIYDRQQTSLNNVMPKWVELHFNPGGGRNQEFFNWGLQGTGGGRLQEIKTEIDAGHPVPLGLKSLSANPGEDHVVLAVGYDTGRYQGDLGDFKEDLKIFIYDPNNGAVTKTLYPVVGEQKYCIDYSDGPHCWRAYFVMTGAYSAKAPPDVGTAGKELVLSFLTGGDDLRGGGDNVSVVVNLRNGAPIRADNVNLGQRWIDNTWQDIGIDLPDSMQPGDIASVDLVTAFRGGFDGDNWNLDRLIVQFRMADGGSAGTCDRNPESRPLVRFTGDTHVYSTPFPCSG